MSAPTALSGPALRPEARAVDRAQLDPRQQAAFDKIMNMLGEAAVTAEKVAENVKAAGKSAVRPYLEAERSSRTALIHGRRGTGKTTLLLSVLKALNESTDPVGRRVVLLDTLDMEPLAEPTNLIGAVLARLEAVAGATTSRAAEQARAWSRAEGVRGEEDVMMRLLDLQTRAASAFGSNLRERAGGLDPDNFAVEVRRAERHRIDFGRQFALAVAKVAEHLRDTRADLGQAPLFVLPVDDLDLNPMACVPLLEGLRAVHSPHLFVLLIADVSVVETVVRLYYQARFIRAGARDSLDSATQGHVRDLTLNALRKHLPPSQRVHLARVTPEQATGFRPIGGHRPVDVYDLFSDARLAPDTVRLAGSFTFAEASARTLGQARPLCLPKPPPRGSDAGSQPSNADPNSGEPVRQSWRYSWIEVFRMSFRQLTDAVLDARRDLAGLAQERLETVLSVAGVGEAGLDVAARHALSARLGWTTIELPEDYRVQTASLEDWTVDWAGAGLDRAEQQELAGILDIEGADADLSTRAQVERSCPTLRRTLAPDDDQGPLDWPMPQHSTCWGYEDAARLLDAADRHWANAPDRLFGAWVDAMTRVIEQALYSTVQPTPETGWSSVQARLRELAKEPLGRRWRVAVLALCTPEMGMSDPSLLQTIEPRDYERDEVQQLRAERSQNRSERFRERAARSLT